MSVEETNKAEADSLSILREKIAAKKKQHEADMNVPFVSKKRERQEVSLVKTEATDLFQIERYRELCDVMDAVYNNYLVAVEAIGGFDINSSNKCTEDTFKVALKRLCKATDEMVVESIKVRWN